MTAHFHAVIAGHRVARTYIHDLGSQPMPSSQERHLICTLSNNDLAKNRAEMKRVYDDFTYLLVSIAAAW